MCFLWTSGRKEERVMESISCDVHHGDHLLDVVDAIGPMPTNIKLQMPTLAVLLQSLAANMGREHIHAMVEATVELRRAFDADDYHAVSAIYGRRKGWAEASENGFTFGVPEAAMKAFAARHRRRT
jgi:hypothetical protein